MDRSTRYSICSPDPEPPGCGFVSVPANHGAPFFVIVQNVPHGTKNGESNAVPFAQNVALSISCACLEILSAEKFSDVNVAGPKPARADLPDVGRGRHYC